MMTEFPHLYPASRAVAAMSAEERIIAFGQIAGLPIRERRPHWQSLRS